MTVHLKATSTPKITTSAIVNGLILAVIDLISHPGKPVINLDPKDMSEVRPVVHMISDRSSTASVASKSWWLYREGSVSCTMLRAMTVSQMFPEWFAEELISGGGIDHVDEDNSIWKRNSFWYFHQIKETKETEKDYRLFFFFFLQIVSGFFSTYLKLL